VRAVCMMMPFDCTFMQSEPRVAAGG
jgi:hypothetical protein